MKRFAYPFGFIVFIEGILMHYTLSNSKTVYLSILLFYSLYLLLFCHQTWTFSTLRFFFYPD